MPLPDLGPGDPSGEPIRTARTPRPPGTSYGGGGGGIAGFAGGGGGFNGGFAPGGFGAPGSPENPRKRKYYATLGDHTPGPSDTVPAMLSPGEFVVNAQSAQQPDNAQALQQMNQPQGYAQGGPVHCPVCGFCHGGEVPGYAGGGFVGAFRGLAQRSQGMQQPGYGQPQGMPAPQGQGGFGVFHPQPRAMQTMQAPQPMAPWAQHPGYGQPQVQMPHPAMHGWGGFHGQPQPMYQPQWGGLHQQPQMPSQAPQTPMGMWDGGEVPGYSVGGWIRKRLKVRHGGKPALPPQPTTGAEDMAKRQLSAFDKAGYFDPNGSAPMLNALTEQGNREGNDYASRVFNQAGIEGADPAQAASLRLRALASAGRGVSDTLGGYRTQYAQNQDAYAKGLMGQQTGADLGYMGQGYAGQLGNWQDANHQRRENSFGAVAGKVVGAVAGGLASGYGGGGLGGGKGGGNLTYQGNSGATGYDPYRTYPQQQ